MMESKLIHSIKRGITSKKATRVLCVHRVSATVTIKHEMRTFVRREVK